MLRAILFDFNGILVDDEPIHLELVRRVLAEEGLVLPQQVYSEMYLGLNDRSCFEKALAAEGGSVEDSLVARLVARKARYFRDLIRRRGYPLFPGAEDLIRDAVRSGLALGVVTGALREEVELAFQQTGWDEAFKLVVSSQDVERSKPDPEGYRLGASLLNSEPPLPARLIHPHEVLAVEDSPKGIEAAHKAGLVTLGIAHSFPPEELERADVVVPGLGGLPLEKLQRLFEEASRR